MSKQQLTSQEYVNNGGIKCPVCHSTEIEGGSIEVEAGIAWQEICCNVCNAEWQDQYKLIGYSELQK